MSFRPLKIQSDGSLGQEEKGSSADVVTCAGEPPVTAQSRGRVGARQHRLCQSGECDRVTTAVLSICPPHPPLARAARRASAPGNAGPPPPRRAAIVARRRNHASNCWPWVRSLTHSPEAVIHSTGRNDCRVANDGNQLAVTRSTSPASTSQSDGLGSIFMIPSPSFAGGSVSDRGCAKGNSSRLAGMSARGW